MRSLILLLLILIFACGRQNVEHSSTLGTISFEPSGDEKAKPHFEKGLLLLHSFEYEDARTSFVKAREIDPDFYMAYWGEAMTFNHPLWSAQYTEEGHEALGRLSESAEQRIELAPTEIERDLMGGVNILFGDNGDKLERDKGYSAYMSELYRKYPDNQEIAAFYALSLLGSSPERQVETYEKGAVIAKSILAENPDHPGALHYLIHSYDDPEHSHMALNAADSYSKVAPDAGHALHMPSHIYVALGMWDEVINSNIASWDASDERRKRLELDNNARNYHALQWLMYGYLQRGETEKALELVTDMKKYHDELPSSRARAYMTLMRAGYIVDAEDWTGELSTWEIQDTDLNVSIRAINYFMDGKRAYQSGELEALDETIATMEELRAAETKRMMQRGAAMCSGVNWTSQLPTQTDINIAHVMEMQLQAISAIANNKPDLADQWLTKACELEDATSFMFGPPSVVKPSHEMYAEWLHENADFDKAREQVLKAQEKTPGRRKVMQLQEVLDKQRSAI